MILLKKQIFFLALSLFIFVFFAMPNPVFATCKFTLHAACADIDSPWIGKSAWTKVNDALCPPNPQMKGNTKKCCCKDDEDGCCAITAKQGNGKTITSYYTATKYKCDHKPSLGGTVTTKFLFGTKATKEQDPAKRHCVSTIKTTTPTASNNAASSSAPTASNNAASSSAPTASNNTPITTFTGSATTLNNPLGTNSIPELIGKIIRAILGVVGSLALIMFVAGGLMWMTSAGNEKRVAAGKNTLVWAAIGLFVVFFSYIIVKFVLEAIGA